jgi:hypothetical protein
MGSRAREVREGKPPRFRASRLNDDEKEYLRRHARYEGSPDHKRNPGDFGLTPPARPRRDKTLCDEAAVLNVSAARALFERGIERGLVSDDFDDRFPRRIWVVSDDHAAFEVKLGGSARGAYHGYPVRRSNPHYDAIVEAWGRP